MRLGRFAVLLLATLVSACFTLPPGNPVTNEVRPIQTASDPTRTLTVRGDGIVVLDSRPPTRGIRFPPGTYVLEAQDDEYWYLRAPAPLEFRTFQNGLVMEGHESPGGLMIGRTYLGLVPAAGYIDHGPVTKAMVWRLNRDFLFMEGREWSKTW